MKKTAKRIGLILFFVILSNLFSNCVILAGTVVAAGAYGVAAIRGTVGILAGIGEAISEAERARLERERIKKFEEESGRRQTLNEKQKNITNNGFGNPAEERLARRTSLITGGVPVDVSFFTLHENSFAIFENAVQHCRTIISFGDSSGEAIYEFDIDVSFEVKKEPHTVKLTAVTSASSERRAKRRVNKDMRKYLAETLELSTDEVKKVKITFNDSRWGVSVFKKSVYGMDTVIQDLEPPCYYQFDVQVEYQKIDNVDNRRNKRTILPSDFDTFNKVYRSNLRSLAGASIDVQRVIWIESLVRRTNANGYYKSVGDDILPIVNFVKVVRVRE